MLSRVADSIYWMSRYVERAENLARFIDVTLNLMLDQPNGATQQQWEPLIYATGDHDGFAKRYGAATQANVIRFLTFDREYPNSIVSVLHAARENARSTRETISSEMWEQLNEFYHFVREAAIRGRLDSASEFFRAVRQASHLFTGVTDATLSHGEEWHFVNLGRLIERADKTSRILDVKYFTLLPNLSDVNTSIDDLQWSAVLRSVSGLEMYRKRYHGITVHRVVAFLVLDRMFPRAVQYCVANADESLRGISGTPAGSYRNLAEQKLGQLAAELAYLHVDEIVELGLHQFIDSLQLRLNSIGEAIHDTFFELQPVEKLTARMQTQTQSQSQWSG
jgi:uncharacterized alpha-E superfamily protein